MPLTLFGRDLILRMGYTPKRKMGFHVLEDGEIIHRSFAGEFWDGGKIGRFMNVLDDDMQARDAKEAEASRKRDQRPDWQNMLLNIFTKSWPYILGAGIAVGMTFIGLDIDLGLSRLQSLLLIPGLIILFFGGWLLIKFIRA